MNEETTRVEEKLVLPRTIHLVPMDVISGFEVRPGFYEKPAEDALIFWKR